MLCPSRYLRFFYLAVYVALMLLAFSLTALGGSFALLAIVLGLALGLQLRCRLLWQAKQHWRVQCDSDGWWLGRATCGLKPAQLAGEVRLWQAFTFLTLVDERGKHPLLLLADSAAPDDLRRLRVWLVSHRSAC
ncbi:protein YgfX [Gilvimarinus polysaccharolyticus]|uniref:protein YgfX n=1 Tax=Gilvimarinus polysaccharolyticus TaxID=863921 RepID=UPI002FC38CEF